MRMLAVVGVAMIVGAAIAAHGAEVPPATRPATKQTVPSQAAEEEALAKWLDGKDVVQVTFVGPEMDFVKMRAMATAAALLPAEVEEIVMAKAAGKVVRVKLPGDFRLIPGESGDHYYLRVELKVTAENVKRLGLMVERLPASGYGVDLKQNRVVEGP